MVASGQANYATISFNLLRLWLHRVGQLANTIRQIDAHFRSPEFYKRIQARVYIVMVIGVSISTTTNWGLRMNHLNDVLSQAATRVPRPFEASYEQ